MLKRLFNTDIPENVYKENSGAIAEYNYRSLLICSLSGFILSTTIMIFSLFYSFTQNVSFAYGGLSLGCLVSTIMAVTVLRTNKQMVLVVLYTVINLILFMAALFGTVFLPTENASSFIGLIALLPSLLLDKPWRVTLFSVFPVLIFCSMTLFIKEYQFAQLDCINVIVMFISGNIIMRHTVNTKLMNLLSVQQIKWNESRYRTLLLETNDVIFEFDSEKFLFNVLDNSNRYPQTEVTIEELNSNRNVYTEDREHYTDLVKRIIDLNESTIYDEIRFINTIGQPAWFSVYATTLIDSVCKERRVIGKLTNIDAQKRREEQLRVLSQTDQLTGLYNKYTTEQLITDCIAQNPNGCHALILADMDNLKRINDTHGHAYGDSALTVVAATLKSSFRHADIVGRIGGDEFMVFLRDCGSAVQAEKLAAALIAKIGNLSADNYIRIPISISIGVTVMHDGSAGRAVLDTEEAASVFTRLYKEADIALYKVKRSDKGGFMRYGTQQKSGESGQEKSNDYSTPFIFAR
jgi:diguanylate cyclase (GGDEF) domain